MPPDATPSTAATPPALLRALVQADPTRPRVTFYDDAAGPTRGERIELSGRVLANWVAKAANLLVDELDVEPGDVVAVDLPAHWRALYWALAVWSVGAVLAPGPDEGAAVLVTDHPAAGGSARVVAVSLPALARRWDGDLPAGALDEAAELPAQPDLFVPLDEPGPAAAALVTRAGLRTAADLGSDAAAVAGAHGWPTGARVLLSTGLADVPTLLAPWTVDGSLVLVRDPDPAAAPSRSDAERITHSA